MAAYAKARFDKPTAEPDALTQESGVMLSGATRVSGAVVLETANPNAAIAEGARLKAYVMVATDMQRNNAPVAGGNTWVRWRGGDIDGLGGWQAATGDGREPPPTALRLAYLPKDVSFEVIDKKKGGVESVAPFFVIHAAK